MEGWWQQWEGNCLLREELVVREFLSFLSLLFINLHYVEVWGSTFIHPLISYLWPSFYPELYTIYAFICRPTPSIRTYSHLLIYLSTHQCTHPFNHLFMQSPIHPSVHPPTSSSTSISIYSFTQLCSHPSIYPPTHPSASISTHYPSFHSSIQSCTYPYINPLTLLQYICQSIHPSVRLSVYLSVHPSIHPSIHPSVHPLMFYEFIHLLVHSPTHSFTSLPPTYPSLIRLPPTYPCINLPIRSWAVALSVKHT